MKTKFFSGFMDRLLENTKKTRRFIYTIVIVLIVSVMASESVLYFRLARAELDDVLLRRETLSRLSAAVLEEKFNGLIDTSKSLASRVRFRKLIDEGEWEEAIQILKSIPSEFPYVDRVFIADPGGTLMADTPPLPNVRGKNFAFRDWYKGVSKNWQPYISEVYKRTAQPQLNVIAIATPIRREADQAVIAILVLQIRLDTIFEWSREIFFGQSALAYFVDAKGQVAAHPYYSPQADIVDLSKTVPVQKVLAGQHGAEVIFDFQENEKKIIAYSPLPVYGWGVVVEQPTRVALQRSRQTAVYILLFEIIFLVILLFWAYLITLITRVLSINRQREKAFLESAGDGLLAIDKDWNIILWNAAASKITGWSKDEAMGKPMRSIVRFVRQSDRTENILFISDAMLSGQVRKMEDGSVLIRKDASELPAGDSAAPIIDENGKVIGAIVVFRDITKEKELNMTRSSFAYASHQMRTPVNEAMWNIELALESRVAPATKEKFKIAYHSMQSVRKLVNQLIEVSEIDQQMMVPQFSEVRLAELIDKLIGLVADKAKEGKIKLTMSPVSAVAAVITDAKLLVRAIEEVLINAIIYSPKNSEVKLIVQLLNGNAIFEVEDNGIGIPLEQQSIIFTKFFRGRNIPEKSIGAGLGLYISHEYIKLLGGKIWFKSEEKKGTTFFISLPVSPPRKA